MTETETDRERIYLYAADILMAETRNDGRQIGAGGKCSKYDIIKYYNKLTI